MAGEPGDGNAVYRTGKSLGERLLRKLQRKATRRMLKWRDLLFLEGGANCDRPVAAGVQHQEAPFGARLQAAGTGGP